MASVWQKYVRVHRVYTFSDKRQGCDRDLVAYTVSILLETWSHTNVTKRLVTKVWQRPSRIHRDQTRSDKGVVAYTVTELVVTKVRSHTPWPNGRNRLTAVPRLAHRGADVSAVSALSEAAIYGPKGQLRNLDCISPLIGPFSLNFTYRAGRRCRLCAVNGSQTTGEWHGECLSTLCLCGNSFVLISG